MPTVEVELYDTQIGFLDRVISQRVPSMAREQALRWGMLEHIKDRLRGDATTFVGGRIERDVLPTPFPGIWPSPV